MPDIVGCCLDVSELGWVRERGCIGWFEGGVFVEDTKRYPQVTSGEVVMGKVKLCLGATRRFRLPPLPVRLGFIYPSSLAKYKREDYK